jgi:protein-S-isoprenylcysteine O-methyltransferase Ste14
MRWFVFILLVLSALFSLSALFPAPAGQAGLLWPIARDSATVLGIPATSLPSTSALAVDFLAAVAVISFLGAAAAFLTRSITGKFWSRLVLVGLVASLLVYVAYLGPRMILPLLVDAVLAWGIFGLHWSLDSLRLPTERNVPKPIHPLMNIPVPWMFILTFLAGVILQLLVPIHVESAEVVLISHILGVVFLIPGLALAAYGLAIFRRAHTTTVPFQKVSALVTWGPYRFTRNPMYVGLTLIYLSEVGFFVQVWSLLLLVLPLLYVNGVIIPYEEAQLRETFGQRYVDYSAHVRRWL